MTCSAPFHTSPGTKLVRRVFARHRTKARRTSVRIPYLAYMNVGPSLSIWLAQLHQLVDQSVFRRFMCQIEFAATWESRGEHPSSQEETKIVMHNQHALIPHPRNVRSYACIGVYMCARACALLELWVPAFALKLLDPRE